MTTAIPPVKTDYTASARRHFRDADTLLRSGAEANGGQLLGFCVECGLKALLLVCGVQPDNDGGIPQNHKFRQHIPTLHNNIHAFGHMIPDGALATCYLAQLPNLDKLSSWSVDHRYHRETAIPLADLPGWKQAAQEIMQMLDQIVTDGI
jgi:hypothetical protein